MNMGSIESNFNESLLGKNPNEQVLNSSNWLDQFTQSVISNRQEFGDKMAKSRASQNKRIDEIKQLNSFVGSD